MHAMPSPQSNEKTVNRSDLDARPTTKSLHSSIQGKETKGKGRGILTVIGENSHLRVLPLTLYGPLGVG
jgi:hypothetical protein